MNPGPQPPTNLRGHPLSLRLQQQPQWDRHFKRWDRQGGELKDPNDIGDADWASDLLTEGLDDHYLRLLSPDAVVGGARSWQRAIVPTSDRPL